MRIVSKFIFICNACFVGAVCLRYVAFNKINLTKSNEALDFNPFGSSIVVLGYAAILMNFLFLLTFLFYKTFKKNMDVSSWLMLTSFLFFIAQIIYFFF